MGKGNPKKREALKAAWKVYKRQRDRVKDDHAKRLKAIHEKYKKEAR